MTRPWLRRFSVQLGIAALGALGLCGAIFLSGPSSSKKNGARTPDGVISETIVTLQAKGRTRMAEELKVTCSRGPESADCQRLAFRVSLDLDRGADSLLLSDALIQKSAAMGAEGMRAEALARNGRPEDALAAIHAMGARAEDDAFAQFALAHIAHFSGRPDEARMRLGRAIALGRGSAANILGTLIAFREGDLGTARHQSEQALALDPDNVDAIYNLAVVSQREDRYHDAREGYLKVLRLDPRHADSRYNLAVLTAKAGAVAEARHNLEKLRALVGPEDARVLSLEKALGPVGLGVPPGRAPPNSPGPSLGP